MPKPKETDPTVTVAELADWLGLSSRTVSQHAITGVMIRASRGRYLLKASVRSYANHLSKAATGRAATQRTDERARLAKVQADTAEHKLAVSRGDYVRATDVEARWCSILRSVRSGCLALPSRIGAQIAHLTAHDITVIDGEVRAVLTELGESSGK